MQERSSTSGVCETLFHAYISDHNVFPRFPGNLLYGETRRVGYFQKKKKISLLRLLYIYFVINETHEEKRETEAG